MNALGDMGKNTAAYQVESGGCRLAFDPANGAVSGLSFKGVEMLAPAAEAFTAQLLGPDGEKAPVKSTEFACFKFGAGLLSYSAHPVFLELRVEIAWRAEGGFFYFRPAVHGVPESHILEWIDAPQVVVPGGGRLFFPSGEGFIVTEPWRREDGAYSKYHPLEFAKRGSDYGGLYPGICQMQFLAFHTDAGSVYFGAHDPTHGTKGVEYAPETGGRTRLSLQTFCSGVRDYVSGFEYVLGGFDGDWMDACEIYRGWLPVPKAHPAGPAWLEESPVVLIYPVRGRGCDKGTLEPNEYFPYVNVMPFARRYAEAFGCKVMALLMHWEGTAPWAPPYVWPPFGGEDALAELRDQLHAEGHLLGLYCSGSAWTQTSSITDYSREEQFEREGLERYMTRGPKGEIEASICNGEQSQRLGYDMCLSEDWPRRTVKNEIMKLADFGVDYAQFFDQNLGGAFHLCYSREHHHPPAPGAWQVETMRSLLAEIHGELRARGSQMALGCEAAAADPYVEHLSFNDARPTFAYGRGMPVPAHSFVHHERASNFMGNQCGAADAIELLESPENLLYRVAYAFNAGDFLSAVLKGNGQIHWGWGASWDFPAPEQSGVVELIRNLNGFRLRYPEFLRHGKMLKPTRPVSGGKWPLRLKGGRTEILDSFLHSSWEAADGRIAQVITNFLPRRQTLRRGDEDIVLEPLSAKLMEE